MNNFWLQLTTWTLAFSFVFGLVFAFIFLASFPFWLLWNWLIPPIFGLPNITLIQAFGLWLMLFFVRNTKFDFSEVKKSIESDVQNKEDIQWNQILNSIKKNYMA